MEEGELDKCFSSFSFSNVHTGGEERGVTFSFQTTSSPENRGWSFDDSIEMPMWGRNVLMVLRCWLCFSRAEELLPRSID